MWHPEGNISESVSEKKDDLERFSTAKDISTSNFELLVITNFFKSLVHCIINCKAKMKVQWKNGGKVTQKTYLNLQK